MPGWSRITAATLLALCFLQTGCSERVQKVPPSATYIIEARKALASGESAAALDALTKSIESKPNVWAYFERAKLHVDKGDEQAALADCESALRIDPQNKDIPWLQKEIKKPASHRFKGRNKLPPSFTK